MGDPASRSPRPPDPGPAQPPAAPAPQRRPIDADQVVIVDVTGWPLAEFDTIRDGVFIEVLAGPDGAPPHPVGGRPAQTATMWATMRVYWKTVQRIQNLSRGVAARHSRDPHPRRPQSASPADPWYWPGPLPPTPTRYPAGMVPQLRELRALRAMAFHMAADRPALRQAVAAALARLHAQFPDWTFTARFGTAADGDAADRLP